MPTTHDNPSQCEALVKRLRRQWVSPLDALHECGVMRLAARIHELRRRGFNIEARDVDDRATGKHWREFRISPAPATGTGGDAA